MGPKSCSLIVLLSASLTGCIVSYGGGSAAPTSSPTGTPTPGSTPTPTPTETSTPVPTPTPGYPIPGNLFVSVLGDTSISIHWGDSIDDQTSQASLAYAAYYSTAGNITTVSEILANGTLIAGANKAGTVVAGLTNATTYFVNVVVTDGDGNRSPYAPQSGRTTSHLYMYVTDPLAGSSIGGRAGADSLCVTAKASSFPSLNCPHSVAFISVNSTDDIASLAVPQMTQLVAAATGLEIVADWPHWGQPPVRSIVTSGVIPVSMPPYEFWDGSNADGTYFAGTDECAGFTGGTQAYVANGNDGTGSWIAGGAVACTTLLPVACVCWAD